MALEGPMLRDSNTVAAANYYNPATPLAGPNGSGQFLAVQFSTAADETSVLVSAAGGAIYGILQNTPGQGDPCDVASFGPSKAVAGAAITRGQALSVDSSGRLVPQASTALAVAYARQSVTAVGTVFDVHIMPGAYT